MFGSSLESRPKASGVNMDWPLGRHSVAWARARANRSGQTRMGLPPRTQPRMPVGTALAHGFAGASADCAGGLKMIVAGAPSHGSLTTLLAGDCIAGGFEILTISQPKLAASYVCRA